MCSEKFKTFPSKISSRVKFRITGHLKGCTERYRNLIRQKQVEMATIGPRSVSSFTLKRLYQQIYPKFTKGQFQLQLYSIFLVNTLPLLVIKLPFSNFPT